ncbi:MAG: NADH:flavin oxidoreductase [Proteobacteria bacterium]|nr:NADH:flavin oxidoreductase [Pseudomonadota bacterium]
MDQPRPQDSPAFAPLRIGPLTLRNRFIKSATNEGSAKGGVPSRRLVKFHEDIAAGGVAMTTVAYCAVAPDGRTFVDQITLDAASVPHLRALTTAVHRHGAAASAQITHGGCFTFVPPTATRRPLSASSGFNKVGIMSGQWLRQGMQEADLERIAAEFVRGAQLAREAGFDAVEIHMGHGYLLSQFLSPLYNSRRDAYGGSIDRRVRFPVMVLQRVLDAVGKELAVVCKISVTDGHPRGNGPAEGAQIARALEAAGAHLLVLSAGLNIESITTMFGSSFPKENRTRVGNPIVAAAMAIQQFTEPKNVKFHELFQLENSRPARAATRMPLAYLGGVKSLANTEQVLREGFDAVALGRVLIHQADLVNAFADGRTGTSGCTSCNRCVAMMYTPGGTSCVLGEPGDAQLNATPAAS